MYCSKQHDWLGMLHLVEFIHNNQTHKSTGKTLFMATYRINPVTLVTVIRNSANPHSKDFTIEIEQLYTWIKKTLESSMQQMKQFANQKQQNKVLTIRQKIWLLASNLTVKRLSCKLSLKQKGPFKITKLIGQEVYKLVLPKEQKIYNIFYMSKLFSVKGDIAKFNNKKLELDKEQSTNQVVKEILDSYQLLDKIEYYISQVNISESENF